MEKNNRGEKDVIHYKDKMGFKMKMYEPYLHGCDECQWLGWGRSGDHLINKYVHIPKNIPGRVAFITRFSSKPDDFMTQYSADVKAPLIMQESEDVTYGPQPNYQCANCEKDGFEDEMVTWDFSSPEVKFCNDKCEEEFNRKMDEGELDGRF